MTRTAELRLALAVVLAALVVAAGTALAVLPGTGTRAEYTGDGVTDDFTFTFRAAASTHVKVYLDDVVQVGGYTVTMNANQESSPGGTVSFTSAPGSNVAIRLQRETPLTQDTVYTPYSGFPAKTTERTFDRDRMIDQEMTRRTDDVLAGKMPFTGPSFTATAGAGSIAFRSVGGAKWYLNDPTNEEHIWFEAANQDTMFLLGGEGAGGVDVTLFLGQNYTTGTKLRHGTSGGGLDLGGPNPALAGLQLSGSQAFINAPLQPLTLYGAGGVRFTENGTPITGSFAGSVTTDVASIAAQSCTNVSITAAGAVAGAECSPGVPAALPTGLSASCYVSTIDTVQFRLCNVTADAIDPAAGLVYRARVWNP